MIICLKNSVAVVLGENSAAQKNSGKMSGNCLGVQERHNSSLHGDPERSQSSPCLHSEPKPLLALPSLAASHGAGWPSVVHLGSPKRNKHTNERAIPQKGQSPPTPYLLPSVRFSADGFGPLSPQIPRRSPRGSVLIFIFKRPVITLDLDITSTQTSSLCLSGNGRGLFSNKADVTKEVAIC